MKMLITPSKAIDKLMENYNTALSNRFIRKPMAWAIFQTWKWADENEREREVDYR